MFQSILFKLLVAVFGLFLLVTVGLTLSINHQFSDFIDQEQKDYRKELTNDHFKHLLKTVVDNAYQTIETLHKQYPNNPEKAKAEALKLLSAIRYQNGSGYLFAYEPAGGGYRFAFHGTKSRLNKRKADLSKPDIKGFAFRQALIDHAKAENNQFTRYHYEKPTTKQIIPKLAYSRLFKPWNWTIVTGVYIDDIDTKVAGKVKRLNQQSDSFFLTLVVVNGIAVLLFTILFIVLGRYLIIQPLKQMAAALKNLHTNSDITSINRLDEDRRDELGILANHVNATIDKFLALFNTLKNKIDLLGDASRGIIQQANSLNATSEVVHGESGTLNGTSSVLLEDTSIMANNLASALDQLTRITSISENVKGDMSRSTGAIEEVSEHFTSIAVAMEEMLATIREIAGTTQKTDHVVRTIEEKSSSLGDRITTLNERVVEIGEITGLIKQISNQTNLLALNATIEAARAGEAGKGFAVVATEVKNLAGRTEESTGQIESQIDALQGISQEAVEMVMEINNIMDEMRGAMETIASSIQEQEATTSEISGLMQQNSNNITSISENVSNVNSSTSELADLIVKSQQELNEINNSVSMIQNQAETVANSGNNLNDQVSTLNNINNDLGKRSGDLEQWAVEINSLL